MVLLLDPHPLLGLDRLVETVGPAPAVEGATGELVDDLHLALGDQVVLVPPVELFGVHGLGEVMDVVDRHRVVEVVHAQLAFDLLDTCLGGDDGALFFVDLVIVLVPQRPDDARRTGSRAWPTRRPGQK